MELCKPPERDQLVLGSWELESCSCGKYTSSHDNRVFYVEWHGLPRWRFCITRRSLECRRAPPDTAARGTPLRVHRRRARGAPARRHLRPRWLRTYRPRARRRARARRPQPSPTDACSPQLTAPHAIDFGAIRRRIGMPPAGGSILHWVAAAHARDAPAAAAARAVVEEEERAALGRMRLNDGFGALAAALAALRGTRTAIATRNGPEALVRFEEVARAEGYDARALFPVQLARDCYSEALGRAVANKPSPEPAHEIIRRWALDVPILDKDPADAPELPDMFFVGDNLDDCLCGRRAGLSSVFLTNREEGVAGSYAQKIVQSGDHVCRVAQDLSQVADILMVARSAEEAPGS